MNKKEISKLETARAKWDDLINEEEVISKLGLQQATLRKYRREGKIKNFRYLAPASEKAKRDENGKPLKPGKKVVYSLIELTEIFSPTV